MNEKWEPEGGEIHLLLIALWWGFSPVIEFLRETDFQRQ
jgi:hypothetical protein